VKVIYFGTLEGGEGTDLQPFLPFLSSVDYSSARDAPIL
jgi:hypothetical protein